MILMSWVAALRAAWISSSVIESGSSKYFSNNFSSYSATASISSPLSFLDSDFKFYFGPSDYQTLKNFEGDLEASIPLGWGIFGWINRFVFLPLFGFLSSFQ